MRYDVVVSGAGPAGARAARLCARSGLRTLLVERGDVPRDKCCAGGLLERAARLLDEPLPSAVVEQEINTVSIIHSDFREDFDLPTRAAVTVRRSAFDAFLAHRAEADGAELWTRSRVSRVVEGPEDVTLTVDGREVRCRSLIVAEGATSRTASALFGPYPGDHQGIGIAASGSLDRDPGGRMEFHLLGTPLERFPTRFSYPLNGWMFAARRGANIGVTGKGLDGTTYQRSMDAMRRTVEERYGELHGLEPSAHPIPMVPRRCMNTKRCLAVGDAAGLASPMSGEGMTNAFKSSALAAGAVARFIERGDPLTSYRRGVRAEIVPVLRASRAISPPVQWLMGVVDTKVLMNRLHDDPAIVSTCFDISKGEREWGALLRLIVVRFPYLFFSSLT